MLKRFFGPCELPGPKTEQTHNISSIFTPLTPSHLFGPRGCRAGHKMEQNYELDLIFDPLPNSEHPIHRLAHEINRPVRFSIPTHAVPSIFKTQMPSQFFCLQTRDGATIKTQLLSSFRV